MIRMKLDDLTNITSLDFDIPDKTINGFTITDSYDQIFSSTTT